MDRETRNRIQRATQAARELLEHEYAEQLEGVFDIRLDGTIATEPGEHLDAAQRVLRRKLVTAVEHQCTSGMSKADAVASYLREAAFTTLNRFVALKMLEARELVQECISRGDQSVGFKEFTGLAPGLVQLSDHGYRIYIESLFDEIGREVRVLFDRRDPASLLWPRRQGLLELLGILNAGELGPVWGEDETIGWVYQYFNSDDERKQMRAESQAPRNSRELAVRNQFFTPRYVVQFLTENTLGRIWYEMRQGDTRLSDLDYLIRRPNEVFLADGEETPTDANTGAGNLTHEEELQRSVHVPFRAKKDPRDIRMLDPACGSGHFLLYAFDLLLTIYEEAWADDVSPASEVTGRTLREDYPEMESLRSAAPGLILRNNLYGIDIDGRCAQIAALALWVRAQRAFKDMDIARDARSTILRTNIVVAEPMPGESELLREFVAALEPTLGELVERVFNRMELAGEAGSLLRLEEHIRGGVRELYGDHGELFGKADADRWCNAEGALLDALRLYAARTEGGRSYQRRLFADDAARGLGFVDVCRQRYDVVLMNPPFGESTKRSLEEIAKCTPTWNRNLACASLTIGLSRLSEHGLAGAVLDRTFANKSSYEDFRRNLLTRQQLKHFVDLGWGVLDANVEVCCVVASSSQDDSLTRFQDCRTVDVGTKAQALLYEPGVEGSGQASVYWHRPLTMSALPNAAFVYDLPDPLVEAFHRYPSLRSAGFEGYTGFQLQSERHFRNHWERHEAVPVGPAELFSLMYNGGEYRRYALPKRQIARLGGYLSITSENFPSYSYRLQNKQFQFRRGVGWGVRGDFLDAHPVDEGVVFTVEGQNIPVQDEHSRLTLLGYLNSTVFQRLVNAICGQHKYSGYVHLVPFPQRLLDEDVAKNVEQIVELKRRWQREKETDWEHTGPKAAFAALTDEAIPNRWIEQDAGRLRELEWGVEQLVRRSLNVAGSVADDLDQYARGIPEASVLDGDDFSPLAMGFERMQFALGVIFGRWRREDLENLLHSASEDSHRRGLPQQLAANHHAPYGGMFPSILVDDPGTSHDLIRHLEIAFHQHKSETGTFWDRHCSLMNEEPREWFRLQFFGEHVRAYTVGRRKAPIYWQLGTASVRYSVWLYYQALTKDSLYRALNDFVVPKLKHEERKLASLPQGTGAGSTASQRAEISVQQGFVSELRAFQEDVARVAPLWDPNLDDGVPINFAPLWRLVPHHRAWQQECKSTWDKLCKGDYDWAHLAMHLWPERVVPKCAEDRSLAIAHGLEDVFWYEDSDGKWQPRKVAESDVEKLVKERTSAAVKDALKSLLEAPAPATGRATRKKAPRAKGTRKRAASARPNAMANGASSSGRSSATVDGELLSKVKEAIGSNGDGASKADVIDATGISASEWNKAIKALLADGSVTQTGERRAARYHLGGGDA
jgi:hypothetical protein